MTLRSVEKYRRPTRSLYIFKAYISRHVKSREFKGIDQEYKEDRIELDHVPHARRGLSPLNRRVCQRSLLHGRPLWGIT